MSGQAVSLMDSVTAAHRLVTGRNLLLGRRKALVIAI